MGQKSTRTIYNYVIVLSLRGRMGEDRSKPNMCGMEMDEGPTHARTVRQK